MFPISLSGSLGTFHGGEIAIEFCLSEEMVNQMYKAVPTKGVLGTSKSIFEMSLLKCLCLDTTNTIKMSFLSAFFVVYV